MAIAVQPRRTLRVERANASRETRHGRQTLREIRNGALRCRRQNPAGPICSRSIRAPCQLGLAGKGRRCIRDAFETAEKVLEGDRSTEDARDRFVEAAREAGILVEPSDDEGSTPKRIYFESSVRIQPHGGETVGRSNQ